MSHSMRWVASKSQVKYVVASSGYVDYLREKVVLYRIDAILFNFPRSRVVVPVDVPKIEITEE